MKMIIGVVIAALSAATASAKSLSKCERDLQANPRYIVSFKAGVKQSGRASALGALGLSASKHIAVDGERGETVSMAVVRMPLGKDIHTAIGQAVCQSPLDCSEALANIESIEKDSCVFGDNAGLSFHNAPFGIAEGAINFGAVRAIAQNPMRAGMNAQRPELPWGVGRVRAPSAWDYTRGARVRVAVIDTGIDASHPDLVGKVDGGYSAVDKSENDADFNDMNGHGTHVAGTIAAKQDGKGVVGVAPDARLYAVKVLGDDGSGTLSDVIDGIVWAASNHDIQVANMSLGAPVDSAAMKRAVRYARGKGLVIVAAAGNSGGSVGFPGAYEDVIAVSASDYQDKLADFSSRGPEVDFVAPGVDVLSSKAGTSDLVSYSGTSMAAPHVAGLAALAVSQGYVGLNGPDGVFAQLKKAARPVAGLDATMQGAGMIDAGRLVR